MLCPLSAPTASSGHRRHWGCYAAASRCHPAALSLVDAPARRAQDRGIVGADCAVGVLHVAPAYLIVSYCQTLRAHTRARPTTRKNPCASGHELLTVVHEPT